MKSEEFCDFTRTKTEIYSFFVEMSKITDVRRNFLFFFFLFSVTD